MSKIFLSIFVMFNMLFATSNTRDIVRDTPIIVKGKSIGKVGNFGKYHALLIYVEKYQYLNNLKTPKNDVEAIAKLLKERYGFQTTTIVRNPRNSDELVEVFDRFKTRLNEDDNLLIYYAGHGSKDGFWQLSKARKKSRVGWIPLKLAVNYTLMEMRAKHILVVADSCYAGTLTRDGVNLNSLSLSDKKYYEKLYKIRSRNVLTSGGFQPVADEDGVNSRHSVFANGFLKMLKSNNKSIFSLEEQYAKVKRYVQLNTANQTPLYSDVKQTGHQDGGDFIFIDYKVLGYKTNVSSYEKKESQRIERVESNYKPKTSKYTLTIHATPSHARVQILNIKPVYYDGMALKKGKYKIKVFKEGYESKVFSMALREDSTRTVRLNKNKVKTYTKLPTGNKIVVPTFPKKKKQTIKGIVYIGGLMYQNKPRTKLYTWQGAKSYCKNLTWRGYRGWRLPKTEELEKLLTKNKIQGKNGGYYIRREFVNNLSGLAMFWTSERDNGDSSARAINFANKGYYWLRTRYEDNVLCVR